MTATANHRLRRALAVATLACGALLVTPAAAPAATITVDRGDDGPEGCTLRNAVHAANLNQPVAECAAGDGASLDTIVLPLSVRLTAEDEFGSDDTNNTGDLDVDSEDGGLRIVGTGSERSVIEQTVEHERVIHATGSFASANVLELENVAIAGGDASGDGGSSGGGIVGPDLTLTDSVVRGNMVGDDETPGLGGGILGATVTLIDTRVRNNEAVGDGAIGGGIASAITGEDEVTLTNSTVSDNIAGLRGGGMQAAGVTMTNTTVSGNEASGGEGGGIALFGSVTPDSLTNSTVSGNTAGTDGGGVSVDIGSPAFTNVTINGNRAGGLGGGIDNRGSLSTPELRNTILAGNAATTEGPNCAGAAPIISRGQNLFGSLAGCMVDGTTGDGDHANVADPRLAALADNGGPTETHALLPGSQAIDSAGTSCPATDQRGAPRPQGPACDIGAFELVARATPSPASNEFRFARLKRNRKRGTAKLTVIVPGPGGLELARTKKVRPDSVRGEAAGNAQLQIKPKGKAKRKLRRRGRAKPKLTVTYSPDGGSPGAKSAVVKLKQKRKRR